MAKRTIEVFIAGCPICDETVKLVKSVVCPSCELHVRDVRTDRAAQGKATEYGLQRVPAVVVDGKVARCCDRRGVDLDALRELGVGVAA